jgi:hypothetical protein
MSLIAGNAGAELPALPPGLAEYLQTLLSQEQESLQPQGRQQRRKELADVSKLVPRMMMQFGRPPVAEPAPPPVRQLRAYAFDPRLATTLETAPIYQVSIPTRWEDLEPGPVGEYLEVVDVDPPSQCAYLPVDLDHPYVVAQDGLSPSQGNPQFHQQMVYAVAMNTIQRFEKALGRPVFWSPLRPWSDTGSADWSRFPPPPPAEPAPPLRVVLEAPLTPLRSRYIQRLRVYPHAFNGPNAHYSPDKRALLFGYFTGDDETNGTVFTALSHDIIVHETTHAIVDGMHSYFIEPSNKEVLAFHEAFADIMALFQHFTYPEVLRHQIAQTRGNLETENLLGQLAQEFGQAIGCRRALRDYLGGPDENGQWQRNTPTPQAYASAREPHQLGSVLVAAVFDAFLSLYRVRIADLLRISTGGTGILPLGAIHPDLVQRLAREAADTAEEVLSICIRAMDYLPPVDMTFGGFLRALITADYEFSSSRGREQRVAFIRAFRAWGIYPRDVTTLSEDSLRWRGPENVRLLQDRLWQERNEHPEFAAQLMSTFAEWRPGGNRRTLFSRIMKAQERFFWLLTDIVRNLPSESEDEVLPGLDLETRPTNFNVDNMRPARTIGALGEVRTSMIVEVVQTHQPRKEDKEKERSAWPPKRGGATLVIDLESWEIRYVISKRLYAAPVRDRSLASRFFRNMEPERRAFGQEMATASPAQRLAETYLPTDGLSRGGPAEPFALLHRRF